jgi:putative Holliday junction resolvase
MPRILGVDYGERRLGFACSDPEGVIALPLRVVETRSDRSSVEAIQQVCRERDVGRIVLGMPISMDGSKGPAAKKVEAFAESLRTATGLPVDLWDERLTTCISERVLLEADLSRQKRRRTRDKLAAQVMLQSYLDARGISA